MLQCVYSFSNSTRGHQRFQTRYVTLVHIMLFVVYYLTVSHHYQPHVNALGSSVDGAIGIVTRILSSFLVERGTIDAPNKQIHDCSFPLLDTGTSIRSGGVKLVLCTQTFLRTEMMWSCQRLPQLSKNATLTKKNKNKKSGRTMLIQRPLQS